MRHDVFVKMSFVSSLLFTLDDELHSKKRRREREARSIKVLKSKRGIN